MKIWLKYVIGAALGIVTALIIPYTNDTFRSAMQFGMELTLRLGRYSLLPLLFFTMTVAVYELRDSHLLFRTAFETVTVTLVTSFCLTMLGIIFVLAANPPHIPISVEGVSPRVTLDVANNVLKLFPFSGFQALLDGVYLLPVYILAGFAGAGCVADKTGAKYTLSLFDSLSRVCYAILCFFIDIVAIGMIAISAHWMISFFDMLSAGIYLHIILLLIFDFVLIVCVIYPLLLKVLLKERYPFRVLYASIASLFAAFFSGDANFTLAVNLRHAEGSLGIRRRIGAIYLPVFSTFARGGTALVTATAFIIVLKSYSRLDMPYQDLVWIFFTSFTLSFFLGAIPTQGAFLALTILCSLYGRGFETGYLILKPAAFFLGSVAAAIDAATALFGSYFLAVRAEMAHHRDIKYFL